MSKAKNPSVNIVPEKNSSDYLSATKLIANGRPDPTNPDWVAIQNAARAGDVQKVDNLLSSSKTNTAAKTLAKTEIFTLPLPNEQAYFSQPQSILYLMGAEGYVNIASCIIDNQVKQINNLQKEIDGQSKLKNIMTLDAQIQLVQEQNVREMQLIDWQNSLEKNIDNMLSIATKHGHYQFIDFICSKLKDKLDLNIFNMSFPYENTLLATAAKLNHFSVVKKLLQYKADPNAGNGKTEMALIHAILNGNIKMVQLLIKNGASLDTIARHRSSVITENDECTFSENQINVDEAIKRAPNSEAMAKCLDEIRSRGEFFRQEMLGKGDTSPLVQNLANWSQDENIQGVVTDQNLVNEGQEDNLQLLGQNLEQVIEEQ